jgi:hypothetical protein
MAEEFLDGKFGELQGSFYECRAVTFAVSSIDRFSIEDDVSSS